MAINAFGRGREADYESQPSSSPPASNSSAASGGLTAFIDQGSEFEGKLSFKDTVRIDGHFKGEIGSENTLIVGESGEIEAAALDVTEIEPVAPDSPLLTLPNCFVTPHVAGFSPLFLEDCAQRQAENITFALTGKQPHGLANPEVIKTIAVMRSTDPGRWEGVPDFSTALNL